MAFDEARESLDRREVLTHQVVVVELGPQDVLDIHDELGCEERGRAPHFEDVVVIPQVFASQGGSHIVANACAGLIGRQSDLPLASS